MRGRYEGPGAGKSCSGSPADRRTFSVYRSRGTHSSACILPVVYRRDALRRCLLGGECPAIVVPLPLAEQPFQPVERLERRARRQLVGADLGEGGFHPGWLRRRGGGAAGQAEEGEVLGGGRQ